MRKKKSEKFQWNDILQNTWLVLLKTVKVFKSKENLRKSQGNMTECNVGILDEILEQKHDTR